MGKKLLPLFGFVQPLNTLKGKPVPPTVEDIDLGIFSKIFSLRVCNPPYPLFCFDYIYCYMEELIRRIVKFILDKKFPRFEDVEITSERAYLGVKGGDNLVYNVFLKIDFPTFKIEYLHNLENIKDLIREAIKTTGIKNKINIYLNYSDED